MVYAPIQSSLGDCYLVAAMSTVAWRPQLIKNLFDSNTTSEAGIYNIKLYIRGKPWLVQIDDEMLFMKDEEGIVADNLRFIKYDK